MIAYGNVEAYWLGPNGPDDWRNFDPAFARAERFQIELSTKLMSGPEGALEHAFCLNRSSLNRMFTKGGRPSPDISILEAAIRDWLLTQPNPPLRKQVVSYFQDVWAVAHQQPRPGRDRVWDIAKKLFPEIYSETET